MIQQVSCGLALIQKARFRRIVNGNFVDMRGYDTASSMRIGVDTESKIEANRKWQFC